MSLRKGDCGLSNLSGFVSMNSVMISRFSQAKPVRARNVSEATHIVQDKIANGIAGLF